MSSRPRTDERGSAVLEAVIGLPAFLLFIGLIIFAGRIAIATQAVDSAAAQAARTASIARTQSTAESTAPLRSHQQAGRASTSTAPEPAVRVDTTASPPRSGNPRPVTATVTCVVNLADLAVPGVPGTNTVTATASSPIDTYRERR